MVRRFWNYFIKLFDFDRGSSAPNRIIILFADGFVCADSNVIFLATGQLFQNGRFGAAFCGDRFSTLKVA